MLNHLAMSLLYQKLPIFTHNPKLKTQNPELRTQNPKLRTQNPELRTHISSIDNPICETTDSCNFGFFAKNAAALRSSSFSEMRPFSRLIS